AGVAPAADAASERVLALSFFRCRRFVVPSFTPYPTSTACRSTFGAGLPWIPGSKAACNSAAAGVEVAAVTGSVGPAAAAPTGSDASAGPGVVVADGESRSAAAGGPAGGEPAGAVVVAGRAGPARGGS